MAEYYNSGIGRNKRRRGKKRSGKELTLLIFDILLAVMMAALLFLSLTIIICQYVSPVNSGFLSVLSLGAPIVYLLDIVVMFYWIVRMRWYLALAMGVMVFIGLFYLSRYYKLEIDRKYDTSFQERKYVKVMTYNVREGRREGVVEYIAKHNPDILCLQEVHVWNPNWTQLEEKYNTTLVREASATNQILTKYRIIRKGEIEGMSPQNGVWADLRIKDDTVRVISLHLQTTAIRLEDTQFLEGHKYILDSERSSKLSSIVERLVENNRKRAVQAEQVSEFIKQSPYRLIVCGDFNDVPLSYTYRTIAKRLDDAFSEEADGFAYTYNTRYRLLRIDNILVSPELKVASYEVDNEVDLSDHYPVIVRLDMAQSSR